mmetsp:Transcript_27569/g.47584  ORF Transcript_27569/g.47584 Transcript_27569/m.47584 type:complete len:147 (+) Transcript_27569:754-1194(+)
MADLFSELCTRLGLPPEEHPAVEDDGAGVNTNQNIAHHASDPAVAGIRVAVQDLTCTVSELARRSKPRPVAPSAPSAPALEATSAPLPPSTTGPLPIRPVLGGTAGCRLQLDGKGVSQGLLPELVKAASSTGVPKSPLDRIRVQLS